MQRDFEDVLHEAQRVPHDDHPKGSVLLLAQKSMIGRRSDPVTWVWYFTSSGTGRPASRTMISTHPARGNSSSTRGGGLYRVPGSTGVACSGPPRGSRRAGRGSSSPRTAAGRATYTRTMGVRHLFAMYDYYHDVMRGFLGTRKDAATWVRFLRYVRAWYPRRHRVYLIQDNLSAHWTPAVRWEARRLRITLVPNAHGRLAPEPDRMPLRRAEGPRPHELGLAGLEHVGTGAPGRDAIPEPPRGHQGTPAEAPTLAESKCATQLVVAALAWRPSPPQ